MADQLDILNIVKSHLDIGKFQDEHWEGSFKDYLRLIEENPLVIRSAHQRVYDMVLSHGVKEIERDKEKITQFSFFADTIDSGKDALFGLERPLSQLMNVFKAAAHGFGPERRVLLLHGPVGSSKSTIVRLLKKGLEAYSRQPDGALYTFGWKIDGQLIPSPMNEEPLLLIPPEARAPLLDALRRRVRTSYNLRLELDLCPVSRYYYDMLLRDYRGDWDKVLDHVVVRRMLISEKDRVGMPPNSPAR